MTKLHLYQANENDTLENLNTSNDVNLKSPALSFFNESNQPQTINSKITAIEAKELIFQSHVKLKFVINDNGGLTGITSLNELSDVKLIQLTSEGYNRREILISDMMIPKNKLLAFDYKELEKATISDVIDALKQSGQHYCLVLDRKSHIIKGVFSATEISRQLQIPINITDNTDFYKVFAAVKC